MTNDPISDLFTRFRNAVTAKIDTFKVPYSNSKKSILSICKAYGFIDSFDIVKDKNYSTIIVKLKYHNGKSVVTFLKRISKPGKRVFVPKSQIPKVLNGYGLSLLNTSKGLIDGKSARLHNVGGELIGIIH